MSAQKTTKSVNKRVQRFDRFGISPNIRRTPQGFVKIPASITRTGVLEYKLPNGATWKELRLPDEVFCQDSLDTLSGAPVTEDHHGLITPDNVNDHAVGYVSSTVRHDSKIVDSDLIIQQRKTIDGVERGDFKEVSAGYTSDIEFTAGEWNGERYDAIQRNIIYNHVAIGPENWARGGSEMALHLDSDNEYGAAVALHLDNINNSGSVPLNDTKQQKRGISMKKIQLRLDGMTFEVEVAENVATTFEAAITKLEKNGSEAAERADSIQGELDSAKEQASDLQNKLDKALEPEAIEKAVTERVQLVQDCKKLHPEIVVEGKTAKDLKLESLEKAGYESARFDGKSEGYVDGFFQAEADKAEAKTDGPSEGDRSVGVFSGTRQDAKENKPMTGDEARMEMLKRNKEACKIG